jgi:hypothetical protein
MAAPAIIGLRSPEAVGEGGDVVGEGPEEVGLGLALINHEYQHDQWIGEVRADSLGHALPPDPDTGQVSRVDGYLVLNPLA